MVRLMRGWKRSLAPGWEADSGKGSIEERGEEPVRRPFRFALRKIAKDLGKFGPRAEAALESAMVELSQMAVGATGGDSAVFANSVAPILE